MQTFASLKEALRYTADNLIEAGCKYTVFIRGPWDSDLDGECSIRVVPRHVVFFDGRLGLTLELSFHNRPDDHRLHDLFLAMPDHRRFRPFKCEFADVACYAAKLGTDVDGATELVTRLLETFFGYAADTGIECEVHDDGVLTNRRLPSDFGTMTDDGYRLPAEWEDLDGIVADVEDDEFGHEYDA